jgi:hypothetical protein
LGGAARRRAVGQRNMAAEEVHAGVYRVTAKARRGRYARSISQST